MNKRYKNIVRYRVFKLHGITSEMSSSYVDNKNSLYINIDLEMHSFQVFKVFLWQSALHIILQ
jgi:hypothetical protein